MVVVDNNILSSLAKIEYLDVLNQLFVRVETTTSVLDELHKDAVAGHGFVARIDRVKSYEDGWLHVCSVSEEEVALTDDILDHSLSYTDAECIAIAENREKRLVTDDGHVGEVALQRGIEVWDLKLVVQACLKKEIVTDETELKNILEALQEKDGYRFSEEDRDDLYQHL